MANIVGIVTQQDVQTGLTLRARVTSPKGHYTAYQDFPCVIRKIGISDEQAVTTDLNTISNKLLANGADSIKNNITAYMPATGENDTTVTYVVGGASNIKDYISNDGIVLKRPAYGAEAIMGSLTITVKKNAAIATRDIGIIIEPYTSEELMQEALSIITWDNIRDKNAPESNDTETNGMFNVMYPLHLMKTIKTDLVTDEVAVNWTITQDVLQPILSDYRINLETGALTRPDYMDIYSQKDIQVSSSMLDVITSKAELVTGGTYYRIGGLVLTASISIAGLEESQAVSFNLKTLSSALTDLEVQEYLETNISKFSIIDTAYGNVEFAKSTLSDTTEYDVYYDTTGVNSSNLKLYSKSDMERTTFNNDLTNSSIKINAVTWSVIDSSTLSGGGEGSSLPSYNITAAGAIPTSGGMLTLNPSNDPTDNSITKVVLRAVINITDYAGTGTKFVKADYWFKLNNATTPEEPTPDPDDPDDGQQTT